MENKTTKMQKMEFLNSYVQESAARDEEYFLHKEKSLMEDMEQLVKKWKEGRRYESDYTNLVNELLAPKKAFETMQEGQNKFSLMETAMGYLKEEEGEE